MIDYIPFKETGYFSEFITDYLAQKAELRCLYHRFPLATNFPAQIKEKQAHYSAENRNTLAEASGKHLYGYHWPPVEPLYRPSIFHLQNCYHYCKL